MVCVGDNDDNEATDDDDDDNDDDDVSDVAHPQTMVNVDLQRRYVDGNIRVSACSLSSQSRAILLLDLGCRPTCTCVRETRGLITQSLYT